MLRWVVALVVTVVMSLVTEPAAWLPLLHPRSDQKNREVREWTAAGSAGVECANPLTSGP